MEKRVSCRAIIIDSEKLVAMYREKNDKIYYTFPGGGINENESEHDCVKRECLEEFGITVEPIKKLYILEDTKTIQHYYLCDWIEGALGMGEGEEFSEGYNNGIYMPVLIPVSNLKNLPLVPPEIKDEVLKVLENGSFDEINEVKYIESSF